MKRKKTAPPSLRKFFPFLIILIIIPLLGCNLLNRIGIGSSEAESMSLDEALEVEPLDSRPTVLEEMGPPDAFTLKFQELEGQTVRWETWSYFDFNTLFEFIDGELLWNIELEPVPDGSIYAHFYEPEQFQAGMSSADVRNLLSDQELLEIDLEALDLEGSLALAGDQILLAFENDQLVYVETVILSPDPEGVPLIDTPPDQIPDSIPTAEAAEAEEPFSFEDQFESDMPLAVPNASEDFMILKNINGQGKFTAFIPGRLLVAYYEDITLADFSLEVDLTFQSPAPGTKAGVIIRGEDPLNGMDHYLHIAIAPVEESLILSVFYETEWKRWDVIDIPAKFVHQDGAYHLGVVGRGDEIFIFLDDVSVAQLRESDVINAGIFGLSLVTEEVPDNVFFDNLVIKETP